MKLRVTIAIAALTIVSLGLTGCAQVYYESAKNKSTDLSVKVDLANAKIAVLAYFFDGGTGTPSLSVEGLGDYGFTQSPEVSDAGINWSGEAPTSAGQPFCITASSILGHAFYVTDNAPISDTSCSD